MQPPAEVEPAIVRKIEQFLSDIISAAVDRPSSQETTALGVAWLAGMHAGVYPDQVEFAKTWACETQFIPAMDDSLRAKKYAAWGRAVHATMSV